MKVCPTCHQPVRNERCGVFLNRKQTAYFDVIKATGDVGISTDELVHKLNAPSANCARQHITQINGHLEETNWRIRADARGKDHGRWRLVRRKVRSVA